MAGKTESVGVRIPVDVLAGWREVVGDGGSVSAYIAERALRPDLASELVALQEEVARLKRELAARPGRPASAVHRDLLGADPASAKPVAAALPVTGTQFPRQMTWAQKQAAEAARKKPGKEGR